MDFKLSMQEAVQEAMLLISYKIQVLSEKFLEESIKLHQMYKESKKNPE